MLVARSEDTLRELAGELAAESGVTVEVVPADLSRPGSPDQIVETLAQRQTDVDVLVNNAGFGARGPVTGIGVGRQLEMIEVNVAALTRLTALLLPGMLERRRGDLECRLHGRVPAGPELGRVLRDEGVRAVVHRGPGRGSPWLGSAGFVPGPGSDGHRVRGAGRRGGQPAVPAGRDGRRAWPGPGTMVCGGARPWSFPACATAPWRSPCAFPRGSFVTKISGYMQA